MGKEWAFQEGAHNGFSEKGSEEGGFVLRDIESADAARLRNNGSESDRSHSELKLKLIYSRNAKRKILFIRFGRGDLKFSMAGQFIFFQNVFIFQL